MTVTQITELTDELVTAMNDLLPQLSKSAKPLSKDDIRDFLAQDGVYLFVYREDADSPILGMLTLATFVIPTGKRAWVPAPPSSPLPASLAKRSARGRSTSRRGRPARPRTACTAAVVSSCARPTCTASAASRFYDWGHDRYASVESVVLPHRLIYR